MPISVNVPVGNKKPEVMVRDDSGRLLGTLLIGRRGVGWLPAGNSVNKWQMTWPKLAKFMMEHGRRVDVK